MFHGTSASQLNHFHRSGRASSSGPSSSTCGFRMLAGLLAAPPLSLCSCCASSSGCSIGEPAWAWHNPGICVGASAQPLCAFCFRLSSTSRCSASFRRSVLCIFHVVRIFVGTCVHQPASSYPTLLLDPTYLFPKRFHDERTQTLHCSVPDFLCASFSLAFPCRFLQLPLQVVRITSQCWAAGGGGFMRFRCLSHVALRVR